MASSSSLSSTEAIIIRDKIRGCIFGSALGDAMGLATEFMSKNTAYAIYGDTPLSFDRFYMDSHRQNWIPGDFTDDTDQHMILLSTILASQQHQHQHQQQQSNNNNNNNNNNTISFSATEFARRLHAWSRTGLLTLRKPSLGIGATVGSVLCEKGYTTHPIATAYEVWNRNSNTGAAAAAAAAAARQKRAAANGAVMRVGCVGCVGFWDNDDEEEEEEMLMGVVRNAVRSARVTHADPRCVFSAVVVAVLVARMLREAVDGGRRGGRRGGYSNGGGVNDTVVALSASPPRGELTVAAFGGDDDDEEPNEGRFELPEDIRRPDARPPPTPPPPTGSAGGGLFARIGHAVSSFLPPPQKQTPAQQWAAIYDEFAQRLKNTQTKFGAPPSRPDPPPPSANLPSPDPQRLAATQVVLEKYKPLLRMYNNNNNNNNNINDIDITAWEADIARYCETPTLATLALDDRATMGYTLKALGAALVCHTLPSPPPAAQQGALFRDAITAVIREAGDADTNAAVCGALVGCRVGYSGLPREWLAGLRNKAWLEERVEALVEIAISGLNASRMGKAGV
ncbi:hypothetical protein HDU86_000976 [Geranomyces michiganensis]|nr:hypothetical protein HDU86_000976 [Geranomyces michiganensis]